MATWNPTVLSLALLAAVLACHRADTDTETETDTDVVRSPVDLTDPEVVQQVGRSSAPYMALTGFGSLYVLRANPPHDNCPEVVEDGNVTRYQAGGGCSDSYYSRYFTGTMVVTEEGPRAGSIVYDAFGSFEEMPCRDGAMRSGVVRDGRADIDADGHFSVQVAMESRTVEWNDGNCRALDPTWYEASYAGIIEPEGDWEAFSGEGTAWWSDLGEVHARTDREVLAGYSMGSAPPGECWNTGLSGTTTLDAGGHLVVITYDGAEDCNADRTTHWTLDGVEQTPLERLGCASVPVAGPGLAATVAAAGAVVLWRRGVPSPGLLR